MISKSILHALARRSLSTSSSVKEVSEALKHVEECDTKLKIPSLDRTRVWNLICLSILPSNLCPGVSYQSEVLLLHCWSRRCWESQLLAVWYLPSWWTNHKTPGTHKGETIFPSLLVTYSQNVIWGQSIRIRYACLLYVSLFQGGRQIGDADKMVQGIVPRHLSL